MLMQVPSQSDFYARSLDFNDFDDNEAFNSPEKSLIRSRTLNESSSKVFLASQRKEMQFSSIQMKECQIKIDTENDFESVQQVDNNFSSLTLSNQSTYKAMTGRNIISNENLYLLDPSSEEKPPLPVKTRSRSLRLEQPRSMYDNVDDANRNSTDTKASTTSSTSSLTSTLSHTSRATETVSDFQQSVVKNKYMSCIETGSSFGMAEHDGENPPPLPLKKKHSKYPQFIELSVVKVS